MQESNYPIAAERIRQAQQIIIDCFTFSKQFLIIPEYLCVQFKGYHPGLFAHRNVPCFTTEDGSSIVFNSDWLVRSLPNYEIDVRFFVFHELRHVHQKYQVKLRNSGDEFVENNNTLDVWEYEFANYITNHGDNKSLEGNLAQAIERDANAYAFALINMYFIENTGWKGSFSLPQNAFKDAQILSKHYYQIKPELKRYIDRYKRKKLAVILQANSPKLIRPARADLEKSINSAAMGMEYMIDFCVLSESTPMFHLTSTVGSPWNSL